ncbi:hypothetical protein O1M54_34525 [Streptomyces diastatochromogenes]|nr:hypothetical protein [Streptomyces diastatochromogenes]
MLTVTPPSAPATGRVSGAALRLELRRAAINDGLLKLSPHLNPTRRHRAHQSATAAGFPDSAARGIAGAVDILVAAEILCLPGVGDEPSTTGHEPVPVGRFESAGSAQPGAVPAPRPEPVRAAQPEPPTDVPDSELECVALALRYHSPVVETFRREAVVTEGLTSYA